MRPDKPIVNNRGEETRGDDEDPDLRNGCEGLRRRDSLSISKSGG